MNRDEAFKASLICTLVLPVWNFVRMMRISNSIVRSECSLSS